MNWNANLQDWHSFFPNRLISIIGDEKRLELIHYSQYWYSFHKWFARIENAVILNLRRISLSTLLKIFDAMRVSKIYFHRTKIRIWVGARIAPVIKQIDIGEMPISISFPFKIVATFLSSSAPPKVDYTFYNKWC